MKLDAVNQIRRDLEVAEEKLNSLRECAQLPIPKLDGLPKAKPQSSPVERIAQKIFEAETAVKDLRLKLSETSLELTEEIYRRVTARQARHVLIRRYVQNQSWREIQSQMFLSESSVFNWHRQARKEFNSADSGRN